MGIRIGLVAVGVIIAGCSPGSPVASTMPISESATVSPTTSATVPPPTTTAALSGTTTIPPTTTMMDPVVVEIEESLSELPSNLEEGVAPGVLDDVDLAAGLPEGSVVTPVEGMLVVSGDTAEVLVEVVLPDGRSDRFVVVMESDGSGWKVMYTVRVS